MPTFSIIIPVYKVEDYIKDCIESVINQTFKDFEAIFVDDCGGDNSIKIVEEYAKTDDRIKIIYHENNQGIATARNNALKYSTGKYITCLDSDDWFEIYALEKIYDAFQKHDVTSIWFDAKKYFENTHTFDSETMIKCVGGYLSVCPEHMCDYTELSWGKAYTAESIKDNDIFWPTNIQFGEDGPFYYEYFTYNKKAYIIEDVLYNYRVRNNSAVRNSEKGIVNINDLYNATIYLHNLYKKLNKYNEYKITILKFLRKSIMGATLCYKHYQESIPLTNNILKKLDFPNNFKEFNISLNPLVTVVLSNKFDQTILYEHLIRIQAQSYKNIELLYIDNGNNTNISRIMNIFAKKDNRIKIIKDSSPDDDINVDSLIQQYSKGDFIVLIKSDNKLPNNKIEELVKDFSLNPLSNKDNNKIYYSII